MSLSVEDSALAVSVNEPGAYREFCFDARLCNLCIDAIKQCDFLQENVTGELVTEDDGCGKAFEVLRLLVAQLLQDVTASQSRIANYLLMNLERWLLNRSSLLYHPLLLKVVYRLMRLTFNAVRLARPLHRSCCRTCAVSASASSTRPSTASSWRRASSPSRRVATPCDSSSTPCSRKTSSVW